MKSILSVVGARPNFMKVAPIHRAFAKHAAAVQHKIVHTGQHYDYNMSDVFFQELQLPEPAVYLGVGSGSHAQVTARVMQSFESVLLEQKPDLVLVVGDVNSTIACALTAVKMGIPVAHVEAGLRSYDRAMPEEVNRVATDAICNYAFVTEQSGLDNLLGEGWVRERIFFVGNTMIDSLHFALPAARRSDVRSSLGLEPQQYALITLHRPSNVDDKAQLKALLEVLTELAGHRKLVLPLHPRTRASIEGFGLQRYLSDNPAILALEPQSPVRFLALMREADFVLTDSGGIQEETTVLGVPCITMRTSTERPVTLTLGTNRLVPPQAEALRRALHAMLHEARPEGSLPPLWDGKAGERIAEIILDQCLGKHKN